MTERQEMWPRAFDHFIEKLNEIRNDEEIEKNEFLKSDLDEWVSDTKFAFEQFNKPRRYGGSIFDNHDVCNMACLVLEVYIGDLEKIVNDVATKYGIKMLKKTSAELETAKKAYQEICEK